MMINIDRLSAEPPNEQLTRQLTRLIADGALPLGMRLPTVRQLAADLGLAPNTIVRCYSDLEVRGLIISDGRRGTSVCAGSSYAKASLGEEVSRAAQAFVELVRSTGIGADEALRAVRSAMADLGARPETG
jgi:DNA-binding transcriptional regulator YhcF (GntR family)